MNSEVCVCVFYLYQKFQAFAKFFQHKRQHNDQNCRKKKNKHKNKYQQN